MLDTTIFQLPKTTTRILVQNGFCPLMPIFLLFLPILQMFLIKPKSQLLFDFKKQPVPDHHVRFDLPNEEPRKRTLLPVVLDLGERRVFLFTFADIFN